MIARHAKVREIHSTERKGSVSHHAFIDADGVSVSFALTPDEYPLAKRALDAGTPLVLSLQGPEVTS